LAALRHRKAPRTGYLGLFWAGPNKIAEPE
jgi:hypothetical protein